MRTADHLGTAVERLVAAGCIAAEDEAAAFVAAAPDATTLDAWLHRREQGEPPSWIIGSTTFCGRVLHVAPGTFVPRAHTEELARRAAAVLPAHGWALDLCTGVGAVAAHLVAQVPSATVVGVDRDAHAAACARRNGVRAVVADVAAPFRGARRFDVVTAVAPYVPTATIPLLAADVRRYEPRVALDGGDDGLRVVRAVVAAAARLLRPGGRLLVEIGGRQDEGLGPDLAAGCFDLVTTWCDDEGDLRGLAARLPT